MKLLLETTGKFMLVDFNQNAAEIHANRPTVIGPSAFINQRTASQELKIFSNEIPDEVTDEEFGQWWAHAMDNDEPQPELAIQSFLSQMAQLRESILHRAAQEEEDQSKVEPQVPAQEPAAEPAPAPDANSSSATPPEPASK